MPYGLDVRPSLLRPPFDLERVRSFSDGVFAVAITLVAAALITPPASSTEAEVASFLAGEWRRYASYVAVFAVVGIFWLGHHKLFELLLRIDATAMVLNLALLCSIGLLPYVVRLLGAYREVPVVHVAFSAVVAVIGGCYLGLLVHATRHRRLVDPRLPPVVITIFTARAALVPAVFGVGAVLSFAHADLSLLAWLLLVPGLVAVRLLWGPTPPVEEWEGGGDEVDARVERLERTAIEQHRTLPMGRLILESQDVSRLTTFSDNVYAFALTLLVLQFPLPALPVGSADGGEVADFLVGDVTPVLVGYVVGYIVIGAFWLGHCRVFYVIERQDPRLLSVNLVHLLVIAVVPFTTMLISTFDGYEITVIAFAAVGAVAAVSLTAVWVHASSGHRLIDPTVPAVEIRRATTVHLIAAAAFVLSIPIALVAPRPAMLVWVTPLVVRRLAIKAESDAHAGPADGDATMTRDGDEPMRGTSR